LVFRWAVGNGAPGGIGSCGPFRFGGVAGFSLLTCLVIA
jgi:hypothetical protein